MGTYTLQDYNNIIFNGFYFKLSSSVIQHIHDLASQVGSPSYIKTPTFQKRDKSNNSPRRKDGSKGSDSSSQNKFESLKLFKTTKIEQKTGIEADIDLIRSYLNKLSDKNFDELKLKIFEILDKLMETHESDTKNMTRVGGILFEIASTNRFFSKLYADLYAELINNYSIMEEVFDENFKHFLTLFDDIKYVSPEVDYDEFCKNNKTNEKRKALSQFFLNLCINDIISFEQIINLTKTMLNKVFLIINMENKDAEITEFTENISILYTKESFKDVKDIVNGMTITQCIEKLAKCKSKDYSSLTSKCIFKYMDMIGA